MGALCSRRAASSLETHPLPSPHGNSEEEHGSSSSAAATHCATSARGAGGSSTKRRVRKRTKTGEDCVADQDRATESAERHDEVFDGEIREPCEEDREPEGWLTVSKENSRGQQMCQPRQKEEAHVKANDEESIARSAEHAPPKTSLRSRVATALASESNGGGSKNSLRGRDRVVSYIEIVLGKLEGKEGPPPKQELQTKVMPSVVASLKSLLSSAPAAAREEVLAVLKECLVLPDYQADVAMFQEALQRCLKIAREFEETSGSLEKPKKGGVQLTVKKTFVEVISTEVDEEDSYFRALSDPTTGPPRTFSTPVARQVEGGRFTEDVAEQDEEEHLALVEQPAKLDSFRWLEAPRGDSDQLSQDLFTGTATPATPVHDVGDVAYVGLPVLGQSATAKPNIVIKNTFVTKVLDEGCGGDDDEDGDALADYRSCSDPTTGGLREWHERLKLGCGQFPPKPKVLEENMRDIATLDVASSEKKTSNSVQQILGTPAEVSFTDQEGDTTILKAGAAGIMSIQINGQELDDINLLELEFVGNGQYCVYMQGMGAVIVNPPPGPEQYKFCEQLIELAATSGVQVKSRSSGNTLESHADLTALDGSAAPVVAEGEHSFQAHGIDYNTAHLMGYLNIWEGQTPWPFDYQGCEGLKSDTHACTFLGQGPEFGWNHYFHTEVGSMGSVKPDYRQFTKSGFEGRLSVISESQVHTGGLHRYLVQFSAGDLSKADGVGFLFSPRLPCKKNIQRIVSIFVNQRGTICMRVFQDVIRASAHVKALKCGDWVELTMDLDNSVAYFAIWRDDFTRPASTAEFAFANKMRNFYNDSGNVERPDLDLATGHLACVVKNIGVTVNLGS